MVFPNSSYCGVRNVLELHAGVDLHTSSGSASYEHDAIWICGPHRRFEFGLLPEPVALSSARQPSEEPASPVLLPPRRIPMNSDAWAGRMRMAGLIVVAVAARNPVQILSNITTVMHNKEYNIYDANANDE